MYARLNVKIFDGGAETVPDVSKLNIRIERKGGSCHDVCSWLRSRRYSRRYNDNIDQEKDHLTVNIFFQHYQKNVSQILMHSRDSERE